MIEFLRASLVFIEVMTVVLLIVTAYIVIRTVRR